MRKRPNIENIQTKNLSASLKKLISYSKPYYIPILLSLICAGISSMLAIIGPDKLKEMTNIIIEGLMTGIDLEKVKKVGLILVAFYSISFILKYAEELIMTEVTNRFSKQLRKNISLKINKLPLSYFDKTTIGDTLSRMTNDVDTISQTMNNSLSSLVVSITMFIGSIIMMFKTSWILAIVTIFTSLIGFVFMFIILRKSQKYFTNVQEELGNINGHIEEAFSGANIIRTYNAENEINDKFDEINERLFINGRKSQFYSGLMNPIMGFIGNFGYVAVCIIGALLAIKGTITFGVIVAFMIYVRLFTQPLIQFAQSMAMLQSTGAASERVFEFLEAIEMNEESDFKKSLPLNDIHGSVEFKNVKFGYEEDNLIIKNFNAKIKPGEKVAIVGPTGAGKTTIVNLLMKFYELNDGDILIDGVSTKELTRENVHDLFVMVLQDTWIFEGTIKENIRYNDNKVTDEQIEDACKQVGLHHFIKTLPEGYDTILKDDDTLSQGQKQLLTIARSMVSTSPFLILDEATSSVDTRTEIMVQNAMDKLTQNRTSFIIAHRLSTIKNADLILVMKDGNIIEQGNHNDLIKKGGFYRDLYNSQFQDVDK